MADVLSVIADIIKQDKIQKREHAKVMREVQKKLKEKEVDTTEDNADFMGAASQAAADGKKEFEFPPGSGKMYPVTIKDKDTAKKIAKKMDDEDEQEEELSLGDRVKQRMKSEEDEDDDPVGDPDEDEAEEEPADEPSEEQIDKIADLVLQKIRDKADEEEDEEEEPETTEAESGKKEKIDMNPKVESIHKNPHSRTVWEEAIRKVYEEKVPEPIPVIIKSVGKELRDYALKSGGIDRDDFLSVSKTMLQGKMPNARSINNMDTDPREFVFDLMAKTFGWKYTEQYSGVRFQRRHDYVESFQGGYKLQEHCGECGAMDHVDEKKMFSGKGEFEVKYASSKKGPIKVSKFNTLDDAKKFLAQVKGEGMNGIISKGGKPVKEDHHEKDANGEPIPHDDEEGLEEKMDGRKKFSGAQAKKDNEARRAAQRKKLGILGPNEEVEIDEKASDYEDQIKAFLAKGGKIQKGDRPNKRKIDMVTKGFMKKYGAMKKKEADLDAKDKEELEKMMGEAVIQETWLDDDAKKVQSKWKKMDKKAKKKWMDGVMAKAKKEGMPKDELMDVLDDYGLTMEVTMTGKDSDSIEGPAKGMKHKCPTHVKKEGFGYGKNISHTLSENVVDKMNIYWFDTQEISTLMPTSEVEVVTEGYHSMKNHREKFKSTNKIAEGYMVLPAIDRNKYTPMRGMEGPFPTMSGKVLYYDPKAGEYYDRDSDMYISYDQYMEYDKMSPSQRKQMDMGPLGDPKSKEYKAMERIKNKAEKMAKKNRLKAKNESVGMRFIRKHYQKDDE